MPEIHYENGDSEYTIPVTVYVGASDKRGSSVRIGNLVDYTICFSEIDNAWEIIDVDGSTVQNMLKSKEACVKWLLDSIRSH